MTDWVVDGAVVVEAVVIVTVTGAVGREGGVSVKEEKENAEAVVTVVVVMTAGG